MKMEKLIQSITELEESNNVNSDMKPFQILKRYLDKQISYNNTMYKLNSESGAYTSLVKSLINKYNLMRE